MRYLLSIFLTSAAFCDIWYVPEDCETIQAAIEAAVDGDEIIVAAGRWKERIDLSGKAVFVHSVAGPEETTIYGAQAGTVVRCTSGNGAVLEGFSITGGESTQGGGIYTISSSPTFRRCWIEFNIAVQGGGVYAQNGNPHFDFCTFSSNTAEDGDGIWAKLARPKLTSCIFYGDSIGWQSGEMVSITDTASPAGACCIGRSCVQAASVACWQAGGMFIGEDITCVDACMPICNEDVTGDGVVNMTDLLRVISAFGFCP